MRRQGADRYGIARGHGAPFEDLAGRPYDLGRRDRPWDRPTTNDRRIERRRVPSPRPGAAHPLDRAPGLLSALLLFFALVNGVPQILVASAGVIALSLRRRHSLSIPLSHRP